MCESRCVGRGGREGEGGSALPKHSSSLLFLPCCSPYTSTQPSRSTPVPYSTEVVLHALDLGFRNGQEDIESFRDVALGDPNAEGLPV
jgi:hypothetical protein